MALQIPKLDEAGAIEAMQKGTTSLEFFGSLCRKLPTTLAELMKRAEKYIRQYDALTTSRFAKEPRDRGKTGEDKRPDKQERRQDRGPEALNKHQRERKEQRSYQPRIPVVVTPLNVSKAKVLVAVQDKDFIQWPKPMKLINEIERLIKRGYLRNFVQKLKGQRPQQNAAVERPQRLAGGPVNDDSSGTINMIVGETEGHMSRRGKKRSRNREGSSAEVMQIVEHSPMIISFSPEDAQRVQMSYDNALVIEAVIHNFRVQKVLVDEGSKVNLLPYRIFEQMNIPEEQLVRDQAPVKGIRGTPVAVEGKVKVALTLGEPSLSRTHYAVFLMVKLPLNYNAVIPG
ncbi:uncharacterized protein LOC110617828 [Manihot esculenta]|uniref:uncharacterized protein LOC110617828 n=1 Tax=Manihot esculenta TaxID=3983 RepID=UPI000B5D200D|nr:uncharacterized protein LOC110617828 [Manihot esculenta]